MWNKYLSQIKLIWITLRQLFCLSSKTTKHICQSYIKSKDKYLYKKKHWPNLSSKEIAYCILNDGKHPKKIWKYLFDFRNIFLNASLKHQNTVQLSFTPFPKFILETCLWIHATCAQFIPNWTTFVLR